MDTKVLFGQISVVLEGVFILLIVLMAISGFKNRHKRYTPKQRTASKDMDAAWLASGGSEASPSHNSHYSCNSDDSASGGESGCDGGGHS